MISKERPSISGFSSTASRNHVQAPIQHHDEGRVDVYDSNAPKSTMGDSDRDNEDQTRLGSVPNSGLPPGVFDHVHSRRPAHLCRSVRHSQNRPEFDFWLQERDEDFCGCGRADQSLPALMNKPCGHIASPLNSQFLASRVCSIRVNGGQWRGVGGGGPALEP